MGKIKEIMSKVNSGLTYVVLKGESKKKELNSDDMGYFVYINKKIGLVDRLNMEDDIKKITEFLGV